MSARAIAALKRGRRLAESIMTETVHITRRSENPVTDPETGQVTYPSITIYPTGDEDGRGRIQAGGTEATTTTTAGADVLITTFQAQVPVTVDLQDGDQIEVTGSKADEMMVGRTFRVESVERKTHATKTTANVEEVS